MQGLIDLIKILVATIKHVSIGRNTSRIILYGLILNNK